MGTVFSSPSTRASEGTRTENQFLISESIALFHHEACGCQQQQISQPAVRRSSHTPLHILSLCDLEGVRGRPSRNCRSHRRHPIGLYNDLSPIKIDFLASQFALLAQSKWVCLPDQLPPDRTAPNRISALPSERRRAANQRTALF